MRHLVGGVLVAILGGLILASPASAITIYEVKAKTLTDPTKWYNEGYGSQYYSLMWSNIHGDGKTLDPGHPTGDYTGNWAPANPAWLYFKKGLPNTGNQGIGPYQPSGILTGEVLPRLFTLESWDQSRRFDFSVLFYDPGLTLTGSERVATVILTGNFGTKAGPGLTADPFNAVTLTADQVRAGTMATLNVGCAAGEEVAVTIETKGTYPAGFFIDNIDPTWVPTSMPAPALNPEPTTLAMLAVGLGGLVARRRRK